MEQEIMETVLQEMLHDLKALKHQEQHLLKVREDLRSHTELSLRIEQKLTTVDSRAISLSDEQLTSLKEALREQFECSKSDFKKQLVNHFNHYSLFPESFRMEHFPMLVNTVMRWVVILIVVVFAIWLIAGLVK